MRPLKIGICCYPTFGGSGIVATELALALAERGHELHLITTRMPSRFNTPATTPRVTLHEVSTRSYPMFDYVPTSLAVASKLASVAEQTQLDLIHAHYAIPHAVNAVMATQLLGTSAPRVITTLHGTEITALAQDEHYLPVLRWAIEQSDAVTAPSQWLRSETLQLLGAESPARGSIEVIPNFVDTERYSPRERDREAINELFERSEHHQSLHEHHPILIHISNFRPVKRVDHVIESFALIHRAQESRLLMLGDGPQRAHAEARARQLGVEEAVLFLGNRRDFSALLGAADLFLLPSVSESFGLAALEAQACGVPVIASDVGGLPEVIVHGETGLLTPSGDVHSMAQAALSLIRDPHRLATLKRAARARTLASFQRLPVVERYERLYARTLDLTIRSSTPETPENDSTP